MQKKFYGATISKLVFQKDSQTKVTQEGRQGREISLLYHSNLARGKKTGRGGPQL